MIAHFRLDLRSALERSVGSSERHSATALPNGSSSPLGRGAWCGASYDTACMYLSGCTLHECVLEIDN